MQALRTTPRLARAIDATAELLTKLRIESLFVGSVARAAWLGDLVESGSVDVLAIMQPQQKNQVAMMASHRGFRVDRDEIEQSEELDLVPLNFAGEEGDEVRVHVLLASNALYGRMFGSAHGLAVGAREVRVPAAEDVALLLSMSDDEEALRRVLALPGFDRRLYNEKLVAIGLRDRVVEEREGAAGRDARSRRP